MRVILASKSPDRKTLFKTLYDNFEVQDSNFDESTIKCSTPKKLVMALAEGKCESVFNATSGERCVVGADTVVCVDNKVYGKPKDEEDAKKMIRSYSEKVAKVPTGVCVMYENSDGMVTKIVFANTSSIKFRKIYEDEIERFIATGEYKNIAGSCSIEGSAGKFMEKVVGSYHNILGLPTSQLYEVLRQENLI